MAGIENMLKLSGVQAVLKNLLTAAAPELGAQVNEIANVILAFKEQCDRIERQQLAIMQHLEIPTVRGEPFNAADLGGTTERSSKANGDAGSKASQ
jgi:hypothetical protein